LGWFAAVAWLPPLLLLGVPLNLTTCCCARRDLVIRDDHIVLRWSIDGPRKRETIEYI
jgi:hypothetical protein